MIKWIFIWIKVKMPILAKEHPIGIIIFISVIGSIVIAFLVNLLFKFHLGAVFEVESDAGDALSYTGAVMGSIGTIVLGWISYKQNERLHKLEDYSYMAANSCMIMVNQITVYRGPNSIGDLNNSQEDQVLTEKGIDINAIYSAHGYFFEIEAERIGNATPALIYITKCFFFFGDRNSQSKELGSSVISYNALNKFSRVAIMKENKLKFVMMIAISDVTNRDLNSCISDKFPDFDAEFHFSIISDKNVCTKCKCHFRGKYSESSGKTHWVATEPKVYFYGHEILDESKIDIVGETTDGEP